MQYSLDFNSAVDLLIANPLKFPLKNKTTYKKYSDQNFEFTHEI